MYKKGKRICALLLALCCLPALGLALQGGDDPDERLYPFYDPAADAYGAINVAGQIVLQPGAYEMYEDYLFDEQTGLQVFAENGFEGVKNQAGEEILAPRWQAVVPLSQDLFIVQKDDLTGMIHADGSVVADFSWDWIMAGWAHAQSGLVSPRKGGKYGLMTLEGELIQEPIWEYARGFLDPETGEVHVIIRQNRLYGLADARGNVLIEPVYEQLYDFQGGLSAALRKGKWGYIDTQGEIVLPFAYDQASSFRDGQAVVSKNGRYGVLTPEGTEVLPFAYDYIDDRYGTVEHVRAKQGGKWGLMDADGAFVLGPSWSDGLYSFEAGVFIVGHKGKWGLVDDRGEVLMPLTWYDLGYAGEGGYYTFKRDDARRYGLVRQDGAIILDSYYEEVSRRGNDQLVYARRGEAEYYFNLEGELVFTWP